MKIQMMVCQNLLPDFINPQFHKKCTENSCNAFLTDTFILHQTYITHHLKINFLQEIKYKRKTGERKLALFERQELCNNWFSSVRNATAFL
jgi:hypothetical protein